MGKGGYRGGSTIVGARSGWFSMSPKKAPQTNKFVAIGNDLAANRRDERRNWDVQTNCAVVMSREELAIAFPAKRASAPINTNYGLSDANSRKDRQAAKRRRLGIEE